MTQLFAAANAAVLQLQPSLPYSRWQQPRQCELATAFKGMVWWSVLRPSYSPIFLRVSRDLDHRLIFRAKLSICLPRRRIAAVEPGPCFAPSTSPVSRYLSPGFQRGRSDVDHDWQMILRELMSIASSRGQATIYLQLRP